MQVESLPLPDQFARNIRREIDLSAYSGIPGNVIYLDHALGSGDGGDNIAEQTEMRLDTHARESGRLRPNSGDDSEKVKIRMSTPGVRV